MNADFPTSVHLSSDESLVSLHDTDALQARVATMLVIFLISLFAVSFPTLSKRVSFLRIPRVVFFIGKHLGTGVILATAFAHLLQDAFEALTDPLVLARWNIGRHAGLIVLASLLSIFLVEYISTAYVDRLQSYESPLTTVCSTLTTVLNNGGVVGHSGEQESTMERRPLLGDHLNSRPSPDMHNGSCKQGPCTEQQRDSLENHQQTPSYGAAAAAHQNDHAHGLNVTMRSTHTHTFGQGGEHVVGEIFQGHHRHEPRTIHETHHERVPRLPCLYDCQEFGELAHRHGGGGTAMCENGGGEDNRDMKVGNKRQVVGILVLQLGIMIHSLVIGLTLAIATGSEFASLVVAIIFHQLFEGFSLGIRIASLSSFELSPHHVSSESGGDGDDSEDDGYPHEREGYLSVLKPMLAVLFAVTTPIGIGLGMVFFGREGLDLAWMRLAQGLMSAISAGMLIYAACVEMLAADFVTDPTLWRSGWARQATALGSLLLGVVLMGAGA